MPKRAATPTTHRNQPTLDAFFGGSGASQAARPSPKPPGEVSSTTFGGSTVPQPTHAAAAGAAGSPRRGGYKFDNGGAARPGPSSSGVIHSVQPTGSSAPPGVKAQTPTTGPESASPRAGAPMRREATATAAAVQRTAHGRVICRDFLNANACRKGASCPYAHEAPPPSGAVAPRANVGGAAPSVSPSATRPCDYFHGPKGECRHRDGACPSLHRMEWKHDYVRMPWSEANVMENPSTGQTFRAWTRIAGMLNEAAAQVSDTTALEELLISLLPLDAPQQRIPTDFEALLHVIVQS